MWSSGWSFSIRYYSCFLIVHVMSRDFYLYIEQFGLVGPQHKIK